MCAGNIWQSAAILVLFVTLLATMPTPPGYPKHCPQATCMCTMELPEWQPERDTWGSLAYLETIYISISINMYIIYVCVWA